MRSITVSTGVFSRIWAARQVGEETEDAILDRLLPGRSMTADDDCASTAGDLSQPVEAPGGIRDRRHGVLFPEGFEIFRTYLGTDYRARVRGGRWVLSHNGQQLNALNELSHAIGAKIENAWANWLYRASSGAARPVSELRDPSKISRRRRNGEIPDIF